MRTRQTKLIREGAMVAEVEVQLIDDDEAPGTGWGPYLSLADAQKLDDIQAALKIGDLGTASQMARIFKLTPVAV